VRLYSKLQALNSLARHLGLFGKTVAALHAAAGTPEEADDARRALAERLDRLIAAGDGEA
jgi:hypothetical protein